MALAHGLHVLVLDVARRLLDHVLEEVGNRVARIRVRLPRQTCDPAAVCEPTDGGLGEPQALEVRELGVLAVAKKAVVEMHAHGFSNEYGQVFIYDSV